jgi:hypothetical protein
VSSVVSRIPSGTPLAATTRSRFGRRTVTSLRAFESSSAPRENRRESVISRRAVNDSGWPLCGGRREEEAVLALVRERPQRDRPLGIDGVPTNENGERDEGVHPRGVAVRSCYGVDADVDPPPRRLVGAAANE